MAVSGLHVLDGAIMDVGVGALEHQANSGWSIASLDDSITDHHIRGSVDADAVLWPGDIELVDAGESSQGASMTITDLHALACWEWASDILCYDAIKHCILTTYQRHSS